MARRAEFQARDSPSRSEFLGAPVGSLHPAYAVRDLRRVGRKPPLPPGTPSYGRGLASRACCLGLWAAGGRRTSPASSWPGRLPLLVASHHLPLTAAGWVEPGLDAGPPPCPGLNASASGGSCA